MGDYCGSPYTYSSADSSYNNASAEEYVLHPVEEVLVEEPKITKDGRIARRPGKQAATPDSELTEAELQKRINRRKRNKDAAMRSRQKKLQKTENLEVQVKNLKQSLNNCKAENEELKSELSRLKAQWDAHGRSCVSYAKKRKAEAQQMISLNMTENKGEGIQYVPIQITPTGAGYMNFIVTPTIPAIPDNNNFFFTFEDPLPEMKYKEALTKLD